MFFRLLFSFLCIVFFSACTDNVLLDETDAHMYVFEAKNGFDMFYDAWATHDLMYMTQSWGVVLNGSYFWGLRAGEYFPAWAWKNPWDALYEPYFSDPNITHFVSLVGTGIEIILNSSFATGSASRYFQAWPLVLSGNTLQDITHSTHAGGKYPRTLIGRTERGRVFFFIFSTPLTLAEVGKRVSSLRIFRHDPITLLNLDGGPSTAFSDGTRSYRSDKKLPILFRILP